MADLFYRRPRLLILSLSLILVAGFSALEVLPRYEDPEDLEDPINWFGPVLAGDRLVVASSTGDAISISPYTGQLLGRLDLPGTPTVAPVVADNTLYFLTEDADLVAVR